MLNHKVVTFFLVMLSLDEFDFNTFINEKENSDC